MATDMTAGLFSTPEQYQQAQLAQQQALAMQMAQLSPEQRAAAGLQVAGYQIGGGIGGALGAQDPQMQLAAFRQQAIQGMDPTDPQSIMQAAQKLAQKDPTGASQLAQLAREAASKTAETGLKIAQTKKAENFQAAQADAEKKRNIISVVEDKLSRGEQVDPVEVNKAKLAFGDISRPKTFQQADGTIVTVPPTVDSSMFPNIGKFMSGAGSVGGGGPKMAGVIETPKSMAGKEAEVNKAESVLTGLDDSLAAVKGIRDLRTGSISTNPFLAGVMKNYPSAAMAQEDLVKTVTAGKVIETIADMKAQSQTGATGFGAVDKNELALLEARSRRLNPQSPTFEKDLDYIEAGLLKQQGKIKAALSKKQAALPNANNTAGTEGRVAILQQEYAKAQQMGNQADMAGLAREMATLGAKPSTSGTQKSTLTFEQKVQRTMAANPSASRAAVEAQLRAAGH